MVAAGSAVLAARVGRRATAAMVALVDRPLPVGPAVVAWPVGSGRAAVMLARVALVAPVVPGVRPARPAGTRARWLVRPVMVEPVGRAVRRALPAPVVWVWPVVRARRGRVTGSPVVSVVRAAMVAMGAP